MYIVFRLTALSLIGSVLIFSTDALLPKNEHYQLMTNGGLLLSLSMLITLLVRVDGSNRKAVSCLIGIVALSLCTINLVFDNILVYNRRVLHEQLPFEWHVAAFCLVLGAILAAISYKLSRPNQATA